MPGAWLWVNLWRSKSPRTKPQDYVWQGQGKTKTGTNTSSGDFGKTFKDLLQTIPYKDRTNGLRCDADGKPRTVYSLRHTYATQRLLHGDLDYPDLAKNMGTSVAQIERHYSHVTTLQKAAELTMDKRRDNSKETIHRRNERSVEEALRRATRNADPDATGKFIDDLKSELK
jgi:integrase